MHARTTQLEIDTVRTSLDAALTMFRSSVLPELEEQPGFLGLYVLANPEGQALLVSFWDTAEHAEAGGVASWYSDVLGRFATLFRAPPGRERYEVRLARPPAVAPA